MCSVLPPRERAAGGSDGCVNAAAAHAGSNVGNGPSVGMGTRRASRGSSSPARAPLCRACICFELEARAVETPRVSCASTLGRAGQRRLHRHGQASAKSERGREGGGGEHGAGLGDGGGSCSGFDDVATHKSAQRRRTADDVVH
jgi:hypothetical protein